MSTNAVVKIDFNKEQLAVIESQFFPAGASKAEQQYCFSVAKELGLNPITKEIHFVPRRSKVGDKWVNKVEPMVGRDGFLSIAHRTGQLAGIETSCSLKDIPQINNGKWVVKPELVAECTVWRKDSSKPFTGQVAYSEYCQKNSDGKPTKFWAEKPETMIKKVAESQTLRKAFNIHGVYSPEELGAGFELESGDIVIQTVEAEVIAPQPEKSRLSVVQPPLPPPEPERQESPPPPTVDPDESAWPDPPAGQQTSPSSPNSDSLRQIVSLLEDKDIPYDIDQECGIISAKSYAHKDLLKTNGFKWSSDIKAWVFQFEKEPF